MKLKLFPPQVVIYSDNLPVGIIGHTWSCYTKIRTTFKDNKAVHAHERVHVWQFWLTLGLHSVFKKLSRKYSVWAEVVAYRASWNNGRSLNSAAKALSLSVDVSFEEARSLLVGGN